MRSNRSGLVTIETATRVFADPSAGIRVQLFSSPGSCVILNPRIAVASAPVSRSQIFPPPDSYLVMMLSGVDAVSPPEVMLPAPGWAGGRGVPPDGAPPGTVPPGGGDTPPPGAGVTSGV